MKFVVQETIAAPRPVAFAAASDVRGWPAMMSAIERTEILTREPVGAGTRFRETRRIHGKLASEVMTLAEFDPPERFVVTAFNHGARYRIEHVFEDMKPWHAADAHLFSASDHAGRAAADADRVSVPGRPRKDCPQGHPGSEISHRTRQRRLVRDLHLERGNPDAG